MAYKFIPPNTIRLPQVDKTFGKHRLIVLHGENGFTIFGTGCQPFTTCNCALHTNARSLRFQGLVLAYSLSLKDFCLVRITGKLADTTDPYWFEDLKKIHRLSDNGNGLIVKSSSFPINGPANQLRAQIISQFFQDIQNRNLQIV